MKIYLLIKQESIIQDKVIGVFSHYEDAFKVRMDDINYPSSHTYKIEEKEIITGA